MIYTYGDAAEQEDGGPVEVFDAVDYLAYVRQAEPGKRDTVAECGTCGRMWDDGVSTDTTPTPAGRCPFEYDHHGDGDYE